MMGHEPTVATFTTCLFVATTGNPCLKLYSTMAGAFFLPYTALCKISELQPFCLPFSFHCPFEVACRWFCISSCCW